jgi:SAM-dependent methyltransferase
MRMRAGVAKWHDGKTVERSPKGVTTGNVRFDRAYWERRWAQVLREHPDKIVGRRASTHLLTETADLHPGRALDAGCGHGAEALWLASRRWRVTAVDYSATALDIARSTAKAIGADVAERIEWTEGDLTTWAPPPGYYDLVISLYVHVQGAVGEMVRRLGAGVAPGGTLLLVGHRPVDPATGAPTAAAGQVQVSVDAAVDALDPRGWRIEVAEERPRDAAGGGVDAVVRAVRSAAVG